MAPAAKVAHYAKAAAARQQHATPYPDVGATNRSKVVTHTNVDAGPERAFRCSWSDGCTAEQRLSQIDGLCCTPVAHVPFQSRPKLEYEKAVCP